ncbi:hypothetical protein MANES_08G052750v8 [Manihot esculenta]|uniref:Uncharacterized protein n=1 Tax=Manihot esculenta TaxID=3983 RepID=A0ACB7H8V6_MANES|nr:hypothetical protein MANES_08G052750v8 [Manihot esculenta]
MVFAIMWSAILILQLKIVWWKDKDEYQIFQECNLAILVHKSLLLRQKFY